MQSKYSVTGLWINSSSVNNYSYELTIIIIAVKMYSVKIIYSTTSYVATQCCHVIFNKSLEKRIITSGASEQM